jgi:hypothetical protein
MLEFDGAIDIITLIGTVKLVLTVTLEILHVPTSPRYAVENIQLLGPTTVNAIGDTVMTRFGFDMPTVQFCPQLHDRVYVYCPADGNVDCEYATWNIPMAFELADTVVVNWHGALYMPAPPKHMFATEPPLVVNVHDTETLLLVVLLR